MRNAFPESVAQVPFFTWFPTALALDKRRMPARADVTAMFEPHGVRRDRERGRLVETSPSLRVYYERLKLRAISTLELLLDAEFEAGVERLRHEAQRETDPRPVKAPVDLFVLRR